MRIGILSDTHNEVERTSLAVRRLIDEGAEALIHCGDLTGPDVVYECAGLPAHFVFGNNDYDLAGLRRAMGAIGAVCLGRSGLIELGGKRIAVTHGDSTKEISRLAAEAPDYLFFGHSHWAADERNGATRWVNPGALHRAAFWTVALLDLSTDTLQLLTINDTP
jgi:putative phosphoesterase